METTHMSFSGEWLNKLWYICNMEFYLATKRNKLLIHTTLMYLKKIKPSEKS